jgi:ADP-ribose pyrophosphatase YjhB (NUDIX family)
MTVEYESTWLSRNDFEAARERLPIVYVNVVPVRVDSDGSPTHVGLLLRASSEGHISRSIITGRVLYGERIRDAIARHINKDLGPVAFPRMPTSLQPFDVVEYFPTPEVTGYHDPRQHAVALAYVIAVAGECQPSQESLDLVWLTIDEASAEHVRVEMSGGQDRVLRSALAHAGVLK